MILPGTNIPGLIDQLAKPIISGAGPIPQDYERGGLPASAEILGEIARIPITGIICHRDSMGTDCSEVIEAVRIIREMDDISTVVLDIDSPGGMAWGVEEAAAEIATLRDAGKRVLAWIDPLGASAAYWLASSADSIYALPSGLVGSIGAVRRFWDWSGMFQKLGLVLEAFTSGSPGKIRGMMGKKTTDEDRKHMQESVEEAGGRFRDFVLSRRPSLGSLAFTGDVWSGRKAMEMGLVDGLAPDLGTALAMFLQE